MAEVILYMNAPCSFIAIYSAQRHLWTSNAASASSSGTVLITFSQFKCPSFPAAVFDPKVSSVVDHSIDLCSIKIAVLKKI